MTGNERIDVATAEKLLDLGRRINDPHRAKEQIEGAVALHNMLIDRHVAYLADEVGTGKTYVAMSVIALLRHFDPTMRVLIIAPRQNIQEQWHLELRQFAENHVRVTDLRVRAPDGQPARPIVRCGNLAGLVRETLIDPARDFLCRLTSFSFQLGDSRQAWNQRAKEIAEEAPWLNARKLDMSSKDAFKESYARVVSTMLPPFDLVVIDEAHNLKHGPDASARNRVLSLVLGRGSERSLARRVLLMSATPLEDDHRQVWNQLEVVGKGEVAKQLGDPACTPAVQRDVLQELMIRRLTMLNVAGQPRTRNMYRREWRAGGVEEHDAPLATPDDRQRLVVALVQKKVSEILDSDRFNNAFQIGMLASFESFAETTGAADFAPTEQAPTDEDLGDDTDGEPEERPLSDDGAPSNFDGTEQTEDADERLGVDVSCLAELARSYRKKFKDEMPHPKMDALVHSLERSWVTGHKSLVFVRRVASVTELVRKLERRHDTWLTERLRAELTLTAFAEVEQVIGKRRSDETVFSRFFRRLRPREIDTGAWLVSQLDASGIHGTLFSENYVAWLLDCEPVDVLEELAAALGMASAEVAKRVDEMGSPLVSSDARRRESFEAAQRAALSLLAERSSVKTAAATVLGRWNAHGEQSSSKVRELAPLLGQATFWTELRSSGHAALRDAILPEQAAFSPQTFHERERRREMAASMVRLGQPMIDLYVIAMAGRDSLSLESRPPQFGDTGALARAFVDLLDRQRQARTDETMNAFVELAEACKNHDLIIDANAPELRSAPLSELPSRLGTLLGEQQPVGGVSGQVNATLVKQFRMPGQPFVLVSTELLQEGANLHPFCADVHHYGIAWMPSSLEQRNGRVDRVRSLGHRRLGLATAEPRGADWLQVFYPYLGDTIEVVQVRRVLHRLNRFLTLMHGHRHELEIDSSRCDLADELTRTGGMPSAIGGLLRTPFQVSAEMLAGQARALEVTAGEGLEDRWPALTRAVEDAFDGKWQPGVPGVHEIVGTVRLPGNRNQTVRLRLGSSLGRLIVRGSSDIGDLTSRQVKRLHGLVERCGVAIALEQKRGDSWRARARGDVLLAKPEDDRERVGLLVERISFHADELERVLLREDGADDDAEVAQ